MNGNSLQMILQLVVSLAVVIGMIWLLVKFLTVRSKWMNHNRPLKVLGGIGLGPQKSLQLVEIGGVIYVLGIGQEVTLLRVIDDPREQERIRQDVTGSREQTGLSWLERFRANKQQSGQADFSSILHNQLGDVHKLRQQSLTEWLDGQKRSLEKEKED